METLELRGDYIHLNQLLKVLSWSESGAQANQMIEEGMVNVNGEIAHEKRKKIRAGDTVECQSQRISIISQA